jgi:hypothetical protein
LLNASSPIHNSHTMLIELWERLRGYDKWIDVAASIESSKMRRIAHNGRDGSVSYSYNSGNQLTWIDVQGAKHYAQFTVDDQSPLYELVGGESVAIRYNPSDPDRFYYRDLLQSRISFILRSFLYTGLLLSFLALSFLFRFAFSR